MPSVRGLITLDYEKTDGCYNVNLTIPDGMKAVLYIPEGAYVSINSVPFYNGGEYINSSFAEAIEIIIKH